MKKYDVILFDADNTLFDFTRIEADALCNTFQSFGISWTPQTFELYDRINKHLWRMFEHGEITSAQLTVKRFADFAKEFGVNLDASQVNNTYLNNLATGSTLLEGAEEVCRQLHLDNTLVIVTNGVTFVQRLRLANSKIQPYIHQLIVSEETGYRKPQKGFFDYTFEKLGDIKKERVIIVGDSLSADIKGGKDYGIAACWYNPFGMTADIRDVTFDYEISKLSDLYSVINS